MSLLREAIKKAVRRLVEECRLALDRNLSCARAAITMRRCRTAQIGFAVASGDGIGGTAALAMLTSKSSMAQKKPWLAYQPLTRRPCHPPGSQHRAGRIPPCLLQLPRRCLRCEGNRRNLNVFLQQCVSLRTVGNARPSTILTSRQAFHLPMSKNLWAIFRNRMSLWAIQACKSRGRKHDCHRSGAPLSLLGSEAKGSWQKCGRFARLSQGKCRENARPRRWLTDRLQEEIAFAQQLLRGWRRPWTIPAKPERREYSTEVQHKADDNPSAGPFPPKTSGGQARPTAGNRPLS